LDDPSVATQITVENEIKARGNFPAVEALARDAVRFANEGKTEEEVDCGSSPGTPHDEAAQIGYRKRIIRLRDDGPWPWPKSDL
jgi:hypothetical protein